MINEESVNTLETLAIKKIKAIREEKKVSQLELSLISGVSQNMITYIETGKRAPTLRTLIKLCIALDVSPAILFENNSEKEEAKKNVLNIIQRYM